jgi:hypothetical protein
METTELRLVPCAISDWDLNPPRVNRSRKLRPERISADNSRFENIPSKSQTYGVNAYTAGTSSGKSIGTDDVHSERSMEIREMLNNIHFHLPVSLLYMQKLSDKLAKENTPLSQEGKPDTHNKDYYLIGLPVNIVLTTDYKLVRLKLMMDLQASSENSATQIAAYDIFPKDTLTTRQVAEGKFAIDISKALKFIPAISSASDVISFNLESPIKWELKKFSIDTSDRMSNPVIWLVNDTEISNSFIAYSIIELPKDNAFSVHARLMGEVHTTGLKGLIAKAQFYSDERKYSVGPSAK